MTPEFDNWWDEDELTQTNPYDEGTPVWWAWEGWLAATKRMQELLDEAYADADEVLRPRIKQLEAQLAAEREACAKVRSVLTDWHKFSTDVEPSDFAGCQWLDILNHRTIELLRPNAQVQAGQSGFMDGIAPGTES